MTFDPYTSPRFQQYQKLQQEVDILRSLQHRNIVRYLGTSMQEHVVFIFMAYITGGSLQSILKRYIFHFMPTSALL